MHVVADRFAVNDEAVAIDLATGRVVRLVCGTVGGPSEHLRWTLRCEWFAQIRHPAIAALIDYGRFGETQRFEAWSADHVVRDRSSSNDLLRANLFLRACGRTGIDVPDAGVDRSSYAGGMPSAGAGYPADVEQASLPLGAHGVALVQRRAIQSIAEELTSSAAAHPRVVRLVGEVGAGLTTAALALARVARLSGFVPVTAVTLGNEALLDALQGRSVFLLVPRGAAATWPRLLLEWTWRAGRPHVVLELSRARSREGGVVCLDPVSPGVLFDAVQPILPSHYRTSVERAARRSRGLPGRFVNAIWRESGVPYATAIQRRSVAAERPVPYAVQHRPAAAGKWPRAIGASDHAVRQAIREMDTGPYAAGARSVRCAITASQRRSDWDSAASGLLALCRAQLKRGHLDTARSTLREAEVITCKAEDQRLLLDVALVGGDVALWLARLDDAERLYSTARAAAEAWADTERAAEAALGIGRSLFWRGKFAESREQAAKGLRGEVSPALELKLRACEAMSAASTGDLVRGIEGVTSAFESALRADDPGAIVECGKAAALAHLSVGDRAGLDRDVRAVLRAARVCRDSIAALEVRLRAAESDRRYGTGRTALILSRRLARLASKVPPLIRHQAALLAAVCEEGVNPRSVVQAAVDRSGLGALPSLIGPVQPLAAIDVELMDDMLSILRSCQSGDDEGGVLSQVCRQLQEKLRAAGIGIFVPEADVCAVVALSGTVAGPMAQRVIDVRQGIAPHSWEDSIQAGVPVLYAGDVLGALTARWSITLTPAPSRVMAVMTMAATAAGPILAATLARRRAASVVTQDELIGISEEMERVRRAVERASRAPFHVLIEGESGCGKELVARALHRRGPRRDRPFCTLNCAALPDDLIEAELFGHTKGAFTGASLERTGVFEEAHMGTLFLDEIGELSPRAQAKLLRTLQEGEVRRVGENLSRRVDVRVIAATNRDLRKEVAGGRFRLDLLYRLDVIRITVPPLRERRSDIPILAEHFWRDATARVGSRATLTAATLGALARHDWPGNVRELQNVMASLAVRSPRRGAVLPDALPPPFSAAPSPASSRLVDARRTFEEQFVRAALVRTGGHRGRAASELGISRQGLTKLISRLQIDAGRAE